MEHTNDITTASQVCKRFNNIFLCTPQWFELLVLPDRFLEPAQRIAFNESLLIWISKHKQKVQRLVSYCDPEASSTALNALTCAASQLSRVNVELPVGLPELFPGPQAVSALAWIGNLVACTLNLFCCDEAEPAVSLSPLGSLCHLQALTLGEGTYNDLDAFCHLTKLVLNRFANVAGSGPCEFVDALRHLHVRDGTLSNFIGGVGACPNLKHLGCDYGQIVAQADEELLGTKPQRVHMPAAMTSLTSLESLKLAVGDSQSVGFDGWLDLAFVTHLTNLHSLDLCIHNECTVPAGLSALGKLTDLELSFTGDKPAMLDVDWQRLSSLHAVRIGGSCTFDLRLLRLARAPLLSFAWFEMLPSDRTSAQCYAALAGMFEKYSPDVHVRFGGLHMWELCGQAY